MYRQFLLEQRKVALETEKKYVKKHLTGLAICGAIALAIFTLLSFVVDDFFDILFNRGIIPSLRLLATFISVTFFFQGACLWAKIGHAERGFSQPEGLRYPFYGVWFLLHIAIRFFYYLLFVHMPFILGLGISIPTVIHLIKKILHIRTEERSIKKEQKLIKG